MGKLRQSGDTFFEPLGPLEKVGVLYNTHSSQYREVANVTAHYGNPIRSTPYYYTVKFGHEQDPNKFDTFAEAEAYIHLIHSIKE